MGADQRRYISSGVEEQKLIQGFPSVWWKVEGGGTNKLEVLLHIVHEGGVVHDTRLSQKAVVILVWGVLPRLRFLAI